MAIDRDNNQNQQPKTVAAIGDTGPAIPSHGVHGRRSLLDTNRTVVNRNGASEVLEDFNQKVLKQLEKTQVNDNFAVALKKVDNSHLTQLKASALVVILYPKDSNQKYVAFHTLLLADTAAPIAPLQQQINNQTFHMPRFAEAIWNPSYAAAVEQLMAQHYPRESKINASAEVVPKGFDYEDPKVLQPLLTNALLACGQALELEMKSLVELNLAQDVSPDFVMEVDIAFNSQDSAVNSVGLPLRSDLVVQTLAMPKDQPRQSDDVNTNRSAVVLTQTRGFIELLWDPVRQSNQQMGWANPMQAAPTQKFTPRAVLSQMECVGDYPTITAQLMAALSVLPFAENAGWWSYFVPRNKGQKSKERDLRDIGALNIEGNMQKETDKNGFGSRINTASPTFRTQELGMLLATLVRPDLLISLDVSTCGADTWYNEVFAAAASGNPNAQRVILDCANVLTNGRFGELYRTINRSPVLVSEEIILNGYFEGDDNQRHDIREVDYLAIMNISGDKSPQDGAAWMDTYLRTDQPLIKRLAARQQMIEHAVRGAVITGTSRRCTFDGQFLVTLAKAVLESGYIMRLRRPDAGTEWRDERGVASFAQGAGISPQNTGLFSQTFGGGQQMAASVPFFTGRTW